jgi:hypothetical protein
MKADWTSPSSDKFVYTTNQIGKVYASQMSGAVVVGAAEDIRMQRKPWLREVTFPSVLPFVAALGTVIAATTTGVAPAAPGCVPPR